MAIFTTTPKNRVYMGMRCLYRPCRMPLVACTRVNTTMVRALMDSSWPPRCSSAAVYLLWNSRVKICSDRRLIPMLEGRPITMARRRPAAVSRRMPSRFPLARLAEIEGTRLLDMAMARAVGTLIREITRPA